MTGAYLHRLVLLALLGTPTLAAGQDIPVQLLFDGKPLRITAAPDFTCLDRNSHKWIGCRITPDPATDGYVMERPAPGRYTLHIEIDENGTNPGRFPGDYDVFHPFEVSADAPAVLRVDVPKLIHVTSPWDNNRNMDGMLTRPWSEKPAIEPGSRSTSRSALVTFTWNAVAEGAEYRYVIQNTRDTPYERGPDVVRGTTRKAAVTLRLPYSPDGHYYEFAISARKGGRQVGDFITHDAGVQAWTSRFVVRDKPRPPPADTASRATRRRITAERSDKEAAFLAAWKQAIQKPAWWDLVPPTPLAIHSFGDLSAMWQSAGHDESSRRRFYKLTYQAILDHPGDEHLVALGIDLMAFVADPGDRLPLLEFGVDHFLLYNQRTDTCANCRVGDTAGTMVRDLADAYVSRGEPEAAIRIIQRLVDERGPDVSDYNLALTFETMSRAYWNMKDVNRAKAAIHEGLRRFPKGWQADQLRRTLDRYEKESGGAP